MFHNLKSLKIKDLKKKRVLVRVDFNVPLKNKKVLDDSRLRASLSTLQFLQKKGAKIVVVTHIGRPEGKVVPGLSVTPVVKSLEKMLKRKISVIQNWTDKKLTNLKSGEIIMLENIRFHEGEETNDPVFAKELAALADMFVLDGFAVSHRAAASVSGVAKFLPSFAGLLFEKEIALLDAALIKPKHPFVAIIGGAKIETKLPVVKNILKSADMVLVGGAIVNSFWKAKGFGVGDSLVDDEVDVKSVSALSNKRVFLPVDVIVGDKKGKKIRVVEIGKKPHEICVKGEAILDIGPETLQQFQKQIQKAKTVVWNGAMGYFEIPVYATGTFEIARAIVSKKRNLNLVGGGETVQVMENLKLPRKNYEVSTGGGAMLEYLSGKKLPGVEALRRK
jgi:phosphoglycerate kinase